MSLDGMENTEGAGEDVVQSNGSAAAVAREQFGLAVIRARQRADNMSQKALGDAVGVPQSTISSWERGWSKPDPDVVFQIEEALTCVPGELSIILGYVKPYVDAPPPTIVAAVEYDQELTPYKKQLLLAVYETMRLHD